MRFILLCFSGIILKKKIERKGTVGMRYKEIREILASAGTVDPVGEAALLICRFCGVSPSEIPLIRERDFDCPELTEALKRRGERYPLQYILGEWGFCSESYEVSPGCLIPRPDTELLVETAAELIKAGGRFIEAGVGSGCVSVSLLAARRDVTGTAFDISEDVLEIAGRNAKKNDVESRLKLMPGDMLDGKFWSNTGKFDAVISNPPYIPTGEIAGLEPELSYEPRQALDGGADGLDFYRSIIKNAASVLCEGGIVLLEVGYGEDVPVAAIAGGYGYITEVRRDIEGRGRVLVLRRK
jgi:release factor glutamine methyltransferase